MNGFRLALVADVHGNSWALEAVLDDLARRSPDLTANLGDSLYGPLDPGGTARRLMELDGWIHISGNQDRLVLEAGNDDSARHGNPTLDFVLSQLSPEAMGWLADMPPRAMLKERVLACHGTPDSDCAYLLEDVTSGFPAPRATPDLKAMLGDVKALRENLDAMAVACGHSHLPGLARVGDITVINPGSVGLPAYTDDSPPHAMQTASPHARYALLTCRNARLDVEFICVDYDTGPAVAAALANDRPDWAAWLATGRCA